MPLLSSRDPRPRAGLETRGELLAIFPTVYHYLFTGAVGPSHFVISACKTDVE